MQGIAGLGLGLCVGMSFAAVHRDGVGRGCLDSVLLNSGIFDFV